VVAITYATQKKKRHVLYSITLEIGTAKHLE